MGDIHHCPRCELRFQSNWEVQDHFDLEHATHDDGPPLPARRSKRLSDAEIVKALVGLGGWARHGESIERTVELASFPEAIRFVGRVADLAEAADHHPDIDIRYRKVRLVLSTHSEGGVTAKDLDLAGRIDAVERSASAR